MKGSLDNRRAVHPSPQPDLIWIVGRKLAIGSRPGHLPDPHPQVVTGKKVVNEYVEALKKRGVENIICLLTEGEITKYYDFSLVDLYKTKGIKFSWSPMLAVPTIDSLCEIVSRAISESRTLVHCAGGTQRSGIVAACAVGRLGIRHSPQEAIELVTLKRGFNLHLTGEQVDLIRRYYASDLKG
ncbi:MAG TPA: hypothetical protein VLX91_02035 [Candidatus Acidoferrales bacterium]|nr:hypothetical protein [Candidatus Acidoferrales bacterium]